MGKSASSRHGVSNNFGIDGFCIQPGLVAVQALTVAAPNGVSVARPSGALMGSVVVVTTGIGGGASFRVILQGSHNATEGTVSGDWVTLAQSSNTELITTNSTVILNEEIGGGIDFERWAFLRCRIVDTATVPGTVTAVTCHIIMERLFGLQTLHTSISLTSTGPVLNSTTFERLGGTLVTSGYFVLSAYNNGGSFVAHLDGSYDDGTTFVALASTPTVTSGGPQTLQFIQDGATSIALQGYSHFRIRAVSGGGTFTGLGYLGFESADMRAGLYGAGIAGDQTADTVLCTASGTASAEGVPGANQVTLTFQINQLDGTPLLGARNVELILFDTVDCGMDDLATNATIVSVSTGTLRSTAGGNRAACTTNTLGALVVVITDLAAETLFASLVGNGGVPNSVARFAIVESDQVSCTFA